MDDYKDKPVFRAACRSHTAVESEGDSIGPYKSSGERFPLEGYIVGKMSVLPPIAG